MTDGGIEYRQLDVLPGFEIGSDGTLWRVDGANRVQLHGHTNKTSGHVYVNPTVNGKAIPYLLQTLVMLAFFPARPDKHICVHLDNVHSNNAVSNLMWGRRSDIEAIRRRLGVYTKAPNGFGKRRLALEVEQAVGLPESSHADARVVLYPFDDGYAVSDFGEVWTRKRTGKIKTFGAWREMTPSNIEGYLFVCLHLDGRQTSPPVHRLVLESFCSVRPEGMLARHLNGNPSDNRKENLQWGTAKENSDDMLRHGTRMQGESHRRSILTEDQVYEIRKTKSNAKDDALAAVKYGVSIWTIRAIKQGRLWKHLLAEA
jgi:hypothetical protein